MMAQIEARVIILGLLVVRPHTGGNDVYTSDLWGAVHGTAPHCLPGLLAHEAGCERNVNALQFKVLDTKDTTLELCSPIPLGGKALLISSICHSEVNEVYIDSELTYICA
jgi:hypothetical protein